MRNVVLAIDVTRDPWHLINAHHRIAKMILETIPMKSESMLLEKKMPSFAQLNIDRRIIVSSPFSDESERILLLDVSGNLCPQDVKDSRGKRQNF